MHLFCMVDYKFVIRGVHGNDRAAHAVCKVHAGALSRHGVKANDFAHSGQAERANAWADASRLNCTGGNYIAATIYPSPGL
jgi:hypothetical protein